MKSTILSIATISLMSGAWGCSDESGSPDQNEGAADGDTDADSDADTDTDGDSDADTDTDADTDADADADSDADADTDADSDTDTDTDGDADADTDADTDTDGDSDTDSDSDGDSDSDSDSDGDCNSEPPVLDNHPPPAADYTEEVGGVSIDMVYIAGGTFTLGCESEPCPANTAPVEGVAVSSYHIAKNEVTAAMWEAVMGETPDGFGLSINWYDAMAFACELSRQTGRAYRMQTEAEFEYAAKNHLASLEDIGSGEEWAYNSWSGSLMGGTDPVGPGSGVHTQKTRRDAQEDTGDNITGRLIRSIDGIGPALRLVVSNTTEFPPDYVPPCELCPPDVVEPENSYRDPRWITGSDASWGPGESGFGNLNLRVWEDGTAIMGGFMGDTEGQWFTSNNITFVFVPNSGEITKLGYIFLDANQGSFVSDSMFVGRIYKEPAESVEKPVISDLQSGADLAAAAGPEFRMIDMENIPESAKAQDERLIDGPGQGWSQRNEGSEHHYRKDVDEEEFRFTVNQDGRVMLANGAWFTVGKAFLRVTHESGYTCDYLYAVTEDGMFLHDSFQGYERGDFRGFSLETNGPDFNDLCGDICSDEIPMGEPASFYSTQDIGQSTFVPAPCPADGCY